jgi:transcriptional regulator with XRE-family HTH domain
VDVKEFGEFLRLKRKQKSLSTHELALRSGVSQSYISHVESGRKKGVPSPDILKKLATALGVPHVILMNAAGHMDDTAVSRSATAGETLVELFNGMLLINEGLSAGGVFTEVLHKELIELSEKRGYPDVQSFFQFLRDIANQLGSKKDDIDEYEAFYEENKESFQDFKGLIQLAAAIRNKQAEHNDLLKFLHKAGPITYNGHELTNLDITRILITVEQLFPEYAVKESNKYEE